MRLREASGNGLRLHDATLTLPEISWLQLTHAELAYLSACSTAHRGVQHVDEALRPASAFQLAGFRHVIASLQPLARSRRRDRHHHLNQLPSVSRRSPPISGSANRAWRTGSSKPTSRMASSPEPPRARTPSCAKPGSGSGSSRSPPADGVADRVADLFDQQMVEQFR
ncbi:CHAT domain-containing protein [Nocardia rhizosphaerihabitans]|uniref:CHAT domain-containing protein n=1 Tax=Nocardia rhizosphaerihabitans TaxID=1691570 RepID=UPI00357176B3